MNRISSSLARLQCGLEELPQLDFGYPLGTNFVLPPALDNDDIEAALSGLGIFSDQLRQFYSLCDGVSLPDVSNGFFIKSLLSVVNDKLEPYKIEGEIECCIVVIGSTGGGARFAIRKESGEVLMLKNGLVQQRVFRSDGSNLFVQAHDWAGFVDLLANEVELFLETGAEKGKRWQATG